jgi:hypothetical protein
LVPALLRPPFRFDLSSPILIGFSRRRLRENVIPAPVAREVFLGNSPGCVAEMAPERCRALGR